jgi:hypothetical protein
MYRTRISGHNLQFVARALDARQRLRDWLEPRRPAIVGWLRFVARAVAYTMVLLLSAVWLTSASASLARSVIDLGRPHIADAIMALAGFLSLSPDGIFRLAQILIGAKLLLGTCLFAAVAHAVYARVREGTSSEKMLDLGLLLSALASIVAAGPAVMEPEPRLQLIGELILCVMASGLATFGRGAVSPPVPSDEPAVNPSSLQYPPGSPQLP